MEHQAVKDMIVNMGILTIEDDFESVTKNKHLMEALKLMLIINSSENVHHSINPTHVTKAKRLHPSKYVEGFHRLVMRTRCRYKFSYHASYMCTLA